MPRTPRWCHGLQGHLHWNTADRANGWYYPPAGGGRAQKHIFRVRCVVHPNVTMEDPTAPSATVTLPNGLQNRKRILALKPRKILEEDHAKIMAENFRRAMLDFVEDPDDAAATVAAIVAEDDEDEE